VSNLPIRAIGIVRTPYTEREHTPPQPVFHRETVGRVELDARYVDALDGLDGFSHRDTGTPAGTVATVEHGGVMSTVRVTLQGGETITAAITREAAEELQLASGTNVTVLVKATDVMLAVE
jgi:molybdate transport system regulatory protein